MALHWITECVGLLKVSDHETSDYQESTAYPEHHWPSKISKQSSLFKLKIGNDKVTISFLSEAEIKKVHSSPLEIEKKWKVKIELLTFLTVYISWLS